MASVTGQNFLVGGTPQEGYAPIRQSDGSLKWGPSGGASGGLSSGTIITAADSPYTAQPGETVLVDQTAGSVTVVLPEAPPDGSSVAVKNFQFYAGSSHVTTVQVNAPDSFCRADDDISLSGGVVTLPLNGQGATYWYVAGLAEWFTTANNLPLGGLAYQLGPQMATPANPTGTASTTGVMMGVGVTDIASPFVGAVLATLNGDIYNDTLLDGATVGLSFGFGALPANGDALAGTAVGAAVQYTAAVASAKSPFSITALISSNLAVWVDASLAAVTGGTATIENLTLVVVSFG